MPIIYLTLGLIALVIVVPFGARLLAMRPWAVRAWRRTQQAPLAQSELDQLKRWQARNLALVFLFALTGIADAVVVGLQLMAGPVHSILWALFMFSGLAGLVHHYSARCPRCGMAIGLQSNLMLPKSCVRCRVALLRSRRAEKA